MEVLQKKDHIVIKGSCEYYSQDKYRIDLTDRRLVISVRDGDIDEEFNVKIGDHNARKLVKVLQEFYETEE